VSSERQCMYRNTLVRVIPFLTYLATGKSSPCSYFDYSYEETGQSSERANFRFPEHINYIHESYYPFQNDDLLA
jgi:hypothetical protein